MRLPILYAILAGVATIANIGSQDLFLRFYAGVFAVAISILIGTGVGLVVKYLLDKRYIFDFATNSKVHEARIFILYMAMGIATTLLFWAIEYSFDYFFNTKLMRYLGGAIGLCVGYFLKYKLDQKYVFINRQ